jgi:hypothetical protein
LAEPESFVALEVWEAVFWVVPELDNRRVKALLKKGGDNAVSWLYSPPTKYEFVLN